MSGVVGDSVGTPPPASGSLLAGRYRLDELAGTGGMAQVWSATDNVLNRRVAVKVLHPHLRDDDTFVSRFRQEARSAARLHHHAVVAVYDTVSGPEAEAIVMEYVEGETLRALLDREGRLSPAVVARIAAEVSGALDTAHRAGLTHRDIKPANILLTGDPTRGGVVKVADFGIAKGETDGELTRDGTMVGTAGYLSPEQVEGAPTDGRADEFSLGVVLYEAVTGRLPFTGDTEAARAVARLHQVPTRPDHLDPSIPPALADAIMRSLSRRPDDRFTTMGEMSAAIDSGLARGAVRPGRPTTVAPTTQPNRPATPPAPTSRPPGRRRRHDRRWLGAALLVVLIGTALLLVAALVADEDPIAQGAPAPSEVPAERVLIPISDVTPFDPEGSGEPGENDDLAERAHDGDGDTEWRSERYQQRGFGIKTGVGLLIELDRSALLDRLDVDTPTTGWSAEVYLPETEPTGSPTGAPVGTVTDSPGNASVDLGGTTGERVLLWFTDLGDGSNGFRIDVAELRVAGRI